MAPHPSTLAWKIPWTEEPGGLQSMGSLRVGHDWAASLSLFTLMHWRRKWQPLQYSCLENPRDGGAWWAAIYGVAESRTRLKRLSSSSSSMIVFQIPHICVKIHLFFPFWLSSLWKQPICPSTGAWIKKVWYIHKVEYYSVIKRNQIQSFVQSDGPRCTTSISDHIPLKVDSYVFLRGIFSALPSLEEKMNNLLTVSEKKFFHVCRYIFYWKLFFKIKTIFCLCF